MSKRVIAIIHDYAGERPSNTILSNFKNINNDHVIWCETNSSKYIGKLISPENVEKLNTFNKLEIDKYDSISKCNNEIIKRAKELDPEVEFIHIFHDDLIINDNYDPQIYEDFMREYDLGYYFNPRLNPINYIFNKLSPRLSLSSNKFMKSTLNVFAVDAREYIIIDCKRNNELFNEDLKYLYNIEYIYRCKHNGIIPLLNFYFDHTLSLNDMIRDETNFPRKIVNPEDYIKEEKILSENLKIDWIPETNADLVINYVRKIKGV